MKKRSYIELLCIALRRDGICLLPLFFILPFLLAACDHYDDFTSDRSQTLSFSVDSIRFDTFITTIPSATKTLIVRNQGEAGLRIREVRLEGGAGSPFRINVDGQDLSRTAGNRATDFEVRRRDSIFVRCEVTVPEQHADAPVGVEDAILFTLESGVTQRVVLTAGGQDAWFMRGQTIQADTTLAVGRPIVVYDSLVVAQGATLTLAAGTQLLFHEGAGLVVRGRVVADGTLEAPVVLRGDRTDHIFDYLTYDRLPSRWEGVTIALTSAENQFTYTDLHSARFDIVCDTTVTDTASLTTLTLLSCRLHNIGGDGLRLKDCRTVVRNTEVSNTQGHCVSVTGGLSDFLYCTLAQFYPLSADRGAALYFANYEGDDYHALHRLNFINSVITGYAEDVLIGSSLPNADCRFEYFFKNCFVATEKVTDSPRFVEITYDDDEETASWKNFKLVDTDNFIYDFTPLRTSKMRNIADSNYGQDLLLDRMGRNRLADGAPDAGCYEAEPEPEE